MNVTISVDFLYRDGTTAPAPIGTALSIHFGKVNETGRAILQGQTDEGGIWKFEAKNISGSVEIGEKPTLAVRLIAASGFRPAGRFVLRKKRDGSYGGAVKLGMCEAAAPNTNPRPNPDPDPTAPAKWYSLLAHLSTVFADAKGIPEPGTADFAHAVEQAERPAANVMSA